MTDQYNQPNTSPLMGGQGAAQTSAVLTSDTANQPNPAKVYDELDNLTLSPEDLTLSGAVTQAQVEMAEDSTQILADIKAIMAQEVAENAAA